MKKFWKRFACIGLVTIMVLGTAGCGKGKDGDDSTGGKVDPVSQEEKQKEAAKGVYNVEDLPIDYSFVDADSNYNAAAVNVTEDGRIQLIIQTYKDSASDNFLVSLDLDGKNQKTVKLDNPAPEAPATEEGDKYVYSGFDRFLMGQDGCIYSVRSYTVTNYETYETEVQENYVDVWGTDGKLLRETAIQGMGYDEQAGINRYITGSFFTKDGVAAFVTNGDKLEYFTADKDGNVSDYMPLQLDKKYTDNMDRIVTLKDGKLGIIYYTEDWTKQSYLVFNPETKAVEKEAEIPATVAAKGFYNVYAGMSTDFIYVTGNGVDAISIGDTEEKSLVNFVNSDVETADLQNIIELDENRMLALGYDYENNGNPVVSIYTKVPEEQVVAKQILTLGGLYLQYNQQLKRRVVDFNKNNTAYRIVLKDYNEFNTQEDYTIGLSRLNNDIAAGKCPDILLLSSDMPIDSYISKGLFANVDELIANDNELSQNEYMDNVFEAYRVDGKLYQVISSYYIRTYLAKKELVGDVTSITMDKAKEIVRSMGEGATMFGTSYTRESFMYEFMSACGNDFVNPLTGSCSFDSQEFKDFLTAAKEYTPEAEMDYNYSDDYWQEQNVQYRNNKTLFCSAYFSSFRDLKYTIQGNMGGDVAYLGFPSAQNDGATIILGDNCFAINAKNGTVDAAWQFVRYYLTKDYQTSDEMWSCPILKSAVKEQLKQNMEPNTYTDEETGEVYNYDSFWANGVEIPYDPMTQAQVDAAFSYFCSIKNKPFENQGVLDIINEEAAAFFSGQKPVDDVASIIQSRAKLLINE